MDEIIYGSMLSFGREANWGLTCGDFDPFNSGAVNALRTFQDACNYVGADIVGMVYGSTSGPGEIRSNSDVMNEAFELGKRIVTRV